MRTTPRGTAHLSLIGHNTVPSSSGTKSPSLVVPQKHPSCAWKKTPFGAQPNVDHWKSTSAWSDPALADPVTDWSADTAARANQAGAARRETD
jgi:hypothetical protein